MGRLRSGESLISKLIENGDPIFPPLAPNISASNKDPKKRVAPTVTQSPAKKKKKEDLVVLVSSESESCGSKESEESESQGTQESESQGTQESVEVLEDENSNGESEKNESDDISGDENGDEESEKSESDNSKSGKNDEIESSKSGENESENVRVNEVESKLLSRLCRYFSPKKNKKCFNASEAKSVKKALISDLTTPRVDFDIESMIEKSNEAFAKLTNLSQDFRELYDLVRDFISHHCKLFEAKKELERKGSINEMIIRHNDLLSRSNVEIEALISTKTSLARAKESKASVMIWVEETKVLLGELEEKLARGVTEVDELEKKCRELERNFENTKFEQQNVFEEMGESQNVDQEIGARCERARAGIEFTKARLSSLC